ncbi:MAG: hypothetical protein L0211_03735 [Planctomycetaceae bacterium]|nr:hypothetical protein [Planctomycetaceae bacterium]
MDVFVRDGTLFVIGDAAANDIAIVGTERGIQVTGDGVTTTFSSVRAVQVQAGDGNDHVMMSDADSPLTGIDWTILTGDGEDAVAVLMSGTGEVRGNDLILNMATGAGDDDVLMDLSGSFNDIRIGLVTGLGSDAVQLNIHDGSSATFDLSAELEPEEGGPIDTVPAEDFLSGCSSWSGLTMNFDIRSGGGNDSVSASFFNVSSAINLNANTGEGADSVDVNIVGGSQPSVIIGLDTGEGNDSVNVNAQGDFREFNLDAMTGGGDDLVFVATKKTPSEVGDSRIFIGVHIDTGGGNDFVTLDQFIPAQHFAIITDLVNTGKGADRTVVRWHDELSSEATVQANLSITLDGADAGQTERGDEVLVAFEHGRPEHPLSVDLLWNSEDTPPSGSPPPADPKSLQVEISKIGPAIAWTSDLHGGAGDDLVQIDWEPVSDDATPPTQAILIASFVISTGSGNDAVTIGITDIVRGPFDLDVDLGDGNDFFLLQAAGWAAVGGIIPCIRVFGGAGRDVIIAQLGTVAGNLEVELDGGADNDIVAADLLFAAGGSGVVDIAVRGGLGDDLLTLLARGSMDGYLATLLMDGGDGFDIGIATRNVLARGIERLIRV